VSEPTAGPTVSARILTRNPKIEEAPLQSELMLFDPTSSQFFVLNGTMAYIWRRCDGETPVDRIAEGLAREFDGVESPSAARDVREAVEDLLAKGLLVDSGPAGA
jgi:hypothetical protein